MESTGYSRKLDSTGRLVIPTKLREQMGLITGQEYSFYTLEDDEGRKFICIECPGIDERTLEEARRIVQKYGMNFGQNNS